MTEAEARDLLRRFDGVSGFLRRFDDVGCLEAWIAEQWWRAATDGWSVAKDLEGWRFRLTLVPEGIRLSATAPGGSPPAVWMVKG